MRKFLEESQENLSEKIDSARYRTQFLQEEVILYLYHNNDFI